MHTNTSKLIFLLFAFVLLNCTNQNETKNKTEILEIDKLVQFYHYFNEVNFHKLTERGNETGDISFEKLKVSYSKEVLDKGIIAFFNENFTDEEIIELHKSAIPPHEYTILGDTPKNAKTTITPQLRKKRDTLYKNLFNNGVNVFNEFKQKLHFLDSINYNTHTEINPIFDRKFDRVNGIYETLNYDINNRMNIDSITLKEIPSIKFKDLKSISVKPEQYATLSYSIHMVFNEATTKKLSRISNANIGKPLIIIVNQNVMFAPILRNSIDNGMMTMSGNLMNYNNSKAFVDLILKQ